MKSLITLALVASFLQADTLHAQDVLDRIAQEACGCASALDTTAGAEQRNVQLGLCMLQSAAPYQKELKKKYDIDLNDLENQGERLGQLIGMRLAVHCPEFVALMARMSAESEEEEEALPAGPSFSTMDGALTTVRSGQFLTLVVKKEDGSSQELLLLEHAEGVQQVLSRPDQGRGTLGSWSYAIQDLFDPVSRGYRPFYVVKGVETKP